MGLRTLKTPESFATRTRFHVEEVQPLYSDYLHDPLVLIMPLKHAHNTVSTINEPTCMSWDTEISNWTSDGMHPCPTNLISKLHDHQYACCSDSLSLFYAVHDLEFGMASIGKDSPMTFILIINILTISSFIIAAILDSRQMIDYSDIYESIKGKTEPGSPGKANEG
jgi:hypothetical protein